MSRRDDIEKLIAGHQRRLQKRKEQHALEGVSVDPKILIEIEDLEAIIENLQTELVNLDKHTGTDFQKAPVVQRVRSDIYRTSPTKPPPCIRVFVSSPGEVTEERQFALETITRIQSDPFLQGQVTLEGIAWNVMSGDLSLPVSITPREAISQGRPRPSECDIVIIILWSQLGQPLPYPEYQKADGSPYLSRVEWEYEDALYTSSQGRPPKIIIYRRMEDVNLNPRDPCFMQKYEQWRLVEKFCSDFYDPKSGSTSSDVNTYKTVENFKPIFEHNLKVSIVQFLEKAITDETADKITEQQEDSAKAASPDISETGLKWAGSPFPGLRAFTLKDIPIYFGRNTEIFALIKKVFLCRFVAIVGASGSGKSSLVGAGLLPALSANAISGSKDWLLPDWDEAEGRWGRLYCSPGALSRNPFEALADSLVPLVEHKDRQQLTRELEEDRGSLIKLSGQILETQANWTEIFLFIDQFEELFTIADEGKRQPFVDLLTYALQVAPIRVVVTLRADFYHRCMDYPELVRLLEIGTFPLATPRLGSLYTMITCPAELAGISFEDGLPHRILEDTGTGPGALALMAYILDELYHAASATDRRLTYKMYNELGGVKGAIGKRAEDIFNKLEEEAQKKLPVVFRELIEVHEQGIVTRQRTALSKMTVDAATRNFIDTFTKARLLVQSRDESYGAFVEIAHEELLQNWKRLTDWIETVKNDLFILKQIERAALEWENNSRNEAFLWPNERLQPVYTAISRLLPDLSEVVKEFIRPESERILQELQSARTTHQRRNTIGERLYVLGDARAGVGLRADGLPDIVWQEVPGTADDKVQLGDRLFDVKPFYIARYPVTYIQFQVFLDDSDGFKNDIWWEGLHLQQEEVIEQFYKFDNYPRDRVYWHHAVAFCRWLTQKMPANGWPQGQIPVGENWAIRLPTEWEWQQAATGGSKENKYPWGREWHERCANTQESGLMHVVAVGLYPHGRSPVGADDMAGNILEWCLNKYDPPEDVSIEGDDKRVLRSGCWVDPKELVQCPIRRDVDPQIWPGDVGFRLCCAPTIGIYANFGLHPTRFE